MLQMYGLLENLCSSTCLDHGPAVVQAHVIIQVNWSTIERLRYSITTYTANPNGKWENCVPICVVLCDNIDSAIYR